MRSVRTVTSDDQVKRPNPAILAILDPLHRSLLNNNLQYEQGKYIALERCERVHHIINGNNV